MPYQIDMSEDATRMSLEMSLATKRVLVTGACGFIGTNLVHELIRRGARVTALDLPQADWSRLPEEVECIKADLMAAREIRDVLTSFDIVYHLAARTDLDGRSVTDYAVNTDGTRNLIEALGKLSGTPRFVHYSTQLVVGLFDEARFLDEDEPLRTRTPYGESKIESERVVSSLCPANGFDYTIVRPTSVYGPWGGSPYREFFDAIRRCRYAHVGRADNLVSLVYVENLVDLTMLVSTHPDAAGETYFANDFHPYTMREVVDTAAAYYGVQIRQAPVWLMVLIAYALGLFKMVGVTVPLYPFRLRNIQMTYCYDIQKSVRLGYDPKFDLARGVETTLAWYDAHADFEG
jgi:nucleoside-diphosphate-sugar epimerase